MDLPRSEVSCFKNFTDLDSYARKITKICMQNCKNMHANINEKTSKYALKKAKICEKSPKY